ncbi:MAG: hypothetical protein A3K19_18510 [Lentisphaerae bacterium RIFOXYB12_FULL_65_16]|nr:MAG: hypothetical protein A3K18_13775 [Lentisphaerae bacterium RIFOXYA12_64_32]OGV92955.1 MAG: hypothetical protein A3K19_18510 [Lentisphaerae bacterium RIFOXYB12_FULL_65_16]
MDTSRFLFVPRITRCMRSDCWGDDFLSHAELASANHVYTDDFLREAADDGLGGIWVHVVLRETVPSRLFPKPDPRQLPRLNRLVEKAARYGLRVYTYLCEPRALFADDPFWKKHPEARGRAMLCESDNPHLSGIQYGLCTSTPPVQEFLEESCHNLFERTPGLGGVFSITASEFRTHCYQSYSYPLRRTSVLEEQARSDMWRTTAMYRDPVRVVYKLHHLLDEALFCPRCVQRDPAEVVAEIIALINRGVKSAAPNADVIAWSWCWHLLEADPQRRLIGLLPQDVILLSDWETGGHDKANRILGKRYPVGEYSLSYIGPCPRFVRQLRIAKEHGRRVMAKLQVSTTHEMAAVPHLPVPFNVTEKMVRLKRYGVDGFLGCWNLGGDNTPMSKVAGEMSRVPTPKPATAIRAVAARLFGERNAVDVTQAWRHFSAAWREYPLSGALAWYNPLSYAVAFAFPLATFEKKPPPTPNGFVPGGLPRDARGHLAPTCHYLDHWVAPFGPALVQTAFERLLAEWRRGMRVLDAAVARDRGNAGLRREWALARHIELSVQSTVHILRFYTRWPKLAAARGRTRKAVQAELAAILQAEARTATEAKRLLRIEPRLGFHPEGHAHLFTAADLAHKARAIRASLRQIQAGARAPASRA